MVSVEEIDLAVARERYRYARELLGDAPSESETPSVAVRRQQLALRDPRVSVDETIIELEDLLAGPLEDTDDRALAHALRIGAYGQKRIFTLTEEAIAEARAAVGAHPRVLLAEGHVMMAFDERDRARACFVGALEAGAAHRDAALHALADALYVIGDFDAARERAAEIGGPARVKALRLIANCHAARQDHEAEAEAYRALLESTEGGDRAQADRVSHALALASAGRRADALAELGAAWREDPESSSGRYARERMSHLERHLDAGRRKRLPAFPTTTQKWNYCGPAVLELCFRYLDMELSQEEIADTVKRQTGTPMYEIVTYLRSHAIAARRIEATRERLMAAIDLDLPVIIQEEYSTTSHVAVITGYDEALGTFVAQDPATHRPMLKTFEFTKRSGALYGNGGVIVLGREGPALEAIERACDAVGLIDAPHLSLLDDADRMRPSAAGAEREGATLQEVLRRCDEAIALKPDFKLAWERRLSTRQRLAARTDRPHHRDAFLVDLHHVRTTFAGDEWSHQLHAHYLFDRRLRDEAYAEYLEASRRDPGDANNREWMAECMWLGGDLERAARHFLEALALSPRQTRSAENLAAVYARELVERHRARRPIDSSLAPNRVFERLPGEEPRLMRLAEHFSRVARGANPTNPFNHEVAGDLAAMRQDWVASAEAYRESKRLDPTRSFASLGLARASYRLGQLEAARAELSELADNPRAPAAAFTLYAEVLEALERGEEAAGALVAALGLGLDPKPIVSALFGVYERLGSREAAGARLREVAEARVSDVDLAHAVGEKLDDKGQRGHAIALLRRVVEASPNQVNAVYRLGTLLQRDVLTRIEGERLLSRVVELAPSFAWARIRLAWSLIEDDPARGLALLAELPDQEDGYVLETRSALLARTDGAEAADAALELALRTWGNPEKGLLDLVDWHIGDHRYQRAVVLARSIFERVQGAELAPRARRLWLSAHRHAGAVRDVLPRLRELCADGVPEGLGWQVYWALYRIDHPLAAEGAMQVAEQKEGIARTEWRIHAAAQRAHGGDETLLEAVRGELAESAQAWASFSFGLDELRRWREADAAAIRAFELDDTLKDALSAMEETWTRRGDVEKAIECARRLTELYPHEHVGPERLGALLARRLEVEEALRCSHRAVDAAPFCHNAHWSRALALFAADDLDGARLHASRCLALHEPPTEDDGNDSLMVLYAIDREPEKLDACFLQLYQRQPEGIFAAFEDKLRAVARRPS